MDLKFNFVPAVLLIAGISIPVQEQTQTEVLPVDTIPFEIPVTFDLPVISIEDIKGDSESHDISSLLQRSRDIYVSTAGFTFGSVRYGIRGYDSDNTTVMINGIPVNDPVTGRAFYSTCGGLNDVNRMNVSHNGIGVSRENFAGIDLKIDQNNLCEQYPPGLKLLIKLNTTTGSSAWQISTF